MSPSSTREGRPPPPQLSKAKQSKAKLSKAKRRGRFDPQNTMNCWFYPPALHRRSPICLWDPSVTGLGRERASTGRGEGWCRHGPLIRFGAMESSNPYRFIGFGAMEGSKPYRFIGLVQPLWGAPGNGPGLAGPDETKSNRLNIGRKPTQIYEIDSTSTRNRSTN